MLKPTVPVLIFLHGAAHIWYALLMGKIVKNIPEMGGTGKSWVLPGLAFGRHLKYSEKFFKVVR